MLNKSWMSNQYEDSFKIKSNQLCLPVNCKLEINLFSAISVATTIMHN